MRPLLFIVVLAACPSRKPPAAPASVETSTDQPGTPAADVAPGDTPTPDQPSGSATPGPPGPPASQGDAAAHCLHVGPDHRVVRCYWKREDCTAQMDFNKESGMGKTQECRAAAEVHCLRPSDSGELCYPTAGDCGQMVSNMRKRNRTTSDCTVKKGP